MGNRYVRTYVSDLVNKLLAQVWNGESGARELEVDATVVAVNAVFVHRVTAAVGLISAKPYRPGTKARQVHCKHLI